MGGLVALGVVLITLIGGRHLPFHFPAVIGALLLGYAAYHVAGAFGYRPPPLPASGLSIDPVLPWPTLAFLDGLALAWQYIPLAIPVALATGLFIGLGAASGWIGALIGFLPESVVIPVLIFVGLEMAGQSLRATGRRYSRAWGLAMIPAMASLVSIQVNSVMAGAGIAASQLPEEIRRNLLALTMLGNGFIVTSMLWMSWLIWVIDGLLGRAALAAVIAAGLTLCGAIHSPFADGRLFFPWAAEPRVCWLACGYLLLAGLCALFWLADRKAGAR